MDATHVNLCLYYVDVRGLQNARKVKTARSRIQVNLEDYISDRQYEARGRFGEILLLLPKLQSIATEMIEQIKKVEFYGRVNLDNFLREMLLGENSEKQGLATTAGPQQQQAPVRATEQQQEIQGFSNNNNNYSAVAGGSDIAHTVAGFPLTIGDLPDPLIPKAEPMGSNSCSAQGDFSLGNGPLQAVDVTNAPGSFGDATPGDFCNTQWHSHQFMRANADTFLKTR